MNYRDKNTKIVATISDLRCEPDFLRELFENGMDAVRLNSAHLSIEGASRIVDNVRAVSETIPVMIDTKGPEIRTLDLKEPVQVRTGDPLTIVGPCKEVAAPGEIPVSYADIAAEVPVGSLIMIDDGAVQLTVQGRCGKRLLCRVDNDGTIKARKSVNVPDVAIGLPALTARDLEFLHFAIEKKVDFVAHSFVRCKEDVLAIRTILKAHGSQTRIIAKIENREGVENIDEILDHVDGVMVARGDLGIEVKAAEVPLMQKKLIGRCISRAKPVIVATQMLESMISHPRATRAEISDVANAIIDGTSAVMLSGETAYGDFPVEAVRTMAEVSLELKGKEFTLESEHWKRRTTDIRSALCKSAAYSAVELGAKAFVVPTRSGTTASLLSSFRVRKPIYAQCEDASVMRRLALSHGVRVSTLQTVKTTDGLVASSLRQLIDSGELVEEDLVVFVGASPAHPTSGANFLQVDTVGNMISLAAQP